LAGRYFSSTLLDGDKAGGFAFKTTFANVNSGMVQKRLFLGNKRQYAIDALGGAKL
jgi:hypothetical protein